MAIFKDYLENKSPSFFMGLWEQRWRAWVMIFLANSGQPST